MRKKSLHILIAQLLLFGLALTAMSSVAEVQAEAFANPAFRATWNRTDGPVAAGTNRPYVWGKEPFATKTERYENSPQQSRLVQYFDKGRMEITYPDGDTNNTWYVSSGLLVRDLAAGLVQIGDNLVQSFEPAEIPVVGDETQPLATTPFYSDFRSDAFSSRANRSRVGQTLTTTLRRGGRTGLRSSSAQPKVTVGYYEQASHHNIAEPFWTFMNASGPVNNPAGQTVTGPVFEWQYILGYPLSEPYWTTASFGGKTQEVLIQLFQRRALVFNPTAPAGSQIDFTNVGRHWYNWQYGPAPTAQGDLSVPASVNGQIRPSYGNVETLFRLTAPGYRATEKIAPKLTQPDGVILTESDLGVLRADANGVVRASFYGFDLATDTNNGLGLYRLDLTGKDSNQTSTIYWRIIERVPITPNTPYTNDTSPPPPSVRAIVDPPSGPIGTPFAAFVFDFQVKDVVQGKVAIWSTSPEGEVRAISPFGLASVAEEALDGMGLRLGSPPSPGIWAITLVYKSKPNDPAIIYLKVTNAPPELTLGAALRIYTSGTTNSRAAGFWVDDLQWQNRKPVVNEPAPLPEPEGGE